MNMEGYNRLQITSKVLLYAPMCFHQLHFTIDILVSSTNPNESPMKTEPLRDRDVRPNINFGHGHSQRKRKERFQFKSLREIST